MFVYSILAYCGDPRTPVNGRRLISGYTEGHTVNYTCNVGYELSGFATRMCLSNGTWSANLPTCLSKCFAVCTHNNDLFNVNMIYAIHWKLYIETPLGPSWLSFVESCPYFRGRFVHMSMWLGLQTVTVSSLKRCPLFRVSINERFYCIKCAWSYVKLHS